MQKALAGLTAACMIFSLAALNGCARQSMNDPMGSSMGPGQEGTMAPGMDTEAEKMMQDSMHTMDEKAMEKSMDKTMKQM